MKPFTSTRRVKSTIVRNPADLALLYRMHSSTRLAGARHNPTQYEQASQNAGDFQLPGEPPTLGLVPVGIADPGEEIDMLGIPSHCATQRMYGALAPTSLVSILLLAAGCAGGSAELGPGTSEGGVGSAMGPIAETRYGPVRGATEDGILAFKGIRYGADTEPTRFAAPARPARWNEVLDATSFGASCPQAPTGNPGGLFTSWRPDPAPPFAEDCLFLNVWTPGLADGGQRPVMVWFHGGGFSSGSGSARAYDGVRLAKRGDVVVVTVNHRLNVFGYLALGHFGEGFEDSSVAGLLDMVQALEWVRDNIESFGGDPDTVTIFGESGGGSKVSTLMATEAAEGLFHRVVAQSGAFVRFPDKDRAQALADRVVENLGLSAETIGEIRTLPPEAIQEALVGTGAGTAPTIDGRTLTRHPFVPEAAPWGRDVPLMLGTNRTENALFVGAADPGSLELTWEGLEAAMETAYPDHDTEAIIAGYRQLEPEADPSDIYLEATTDARFLTGHVIQAESKVRQGGAPVYLYLFDWDTPVDGGKWRSPHGLEIGFVFDNVAHSESMSGVGEEQQRVADVMADTWIAFARSGNPNNRRLPEWPPYDLDSRPVMVLREIPELVNDARAAQRALLEDSDSYLRRYER
jgi:para-nitrobenzyl esterase